MAGYYFPLAEVIFCLYIESNAQWVNYMYAQGHNVLKFSWHNVAALVLFCCSVVFEVSNYPADFSIGN